MMMGLDMYLKGRTFNWQQGDDRPTKDGFPIESVILEIGYWRKHPNLHGYIVQRFADGYDECQEILLDEAAVRDIIDAVKDKRLPTTTGFFFGTSDGSQDERTIFILERALAWLNGATPPQKLEPQPLAGATVLFIEPQHFDNAVESRNLIYQASW